jgi:hypothetical protein
LPTLVEAVKTPPAVMEPAAGLAVHVTLAGTEFPYASCGVAEKVATPPGANEALVGLISMPVTAPGVTVTVAKTDSPEASALTV